MDELLKIIRETVREKRVEGLYPPGLEEELEREFAEVVSRASARGDQPTAEIKNLVLDYLAVIDHLSMIVVELESRVSRLEKDESLK